MFFHFEVLRNSQESSVLRYFDGVMKIGVPIAFDGIIKIISNFHQRCISMQFSKDFKKFSKS